MRWRLPLLFAVLVGSCLSCAQNFHWARTYDLKHVAWKVVLDLPTRSIRAEVTEVLRPLAPGLKRIDLDFGKLAVSKVTVNGQVASFVIEANRLVVHLAGPASDKGDVTVRVAYSGKPEAGLYFVPAERAYPASTPMVYTQGEMEDTHHWMPIYDYPDDKATSEGTIVVPDGWFALGNGQLVETKDLKGMRSFRWRCDQPHSTYLISLVAGPYGEGRETWDGIPVSFYYPQGLEKMGRAAFAGTAKMVQFFSEQTGVRYPYAKFAQAVVADFMYGGMENISAVTNTIGALFDPKERPIADAEGLVLHELAHQWFGDLVTAKNWSHIWINEGFASFLPNFYVRKAHGGLRFDVGRYQLLEGAFQAATSSSRPMVSTDYRKPFDMFDGNAYGGGAARMFMLMDLVGEKAFWSGVTTFLNKYRFDNADTEQFFAVMSSVSGRDLDAFRKDWFYQAGAPRLKLSRRNGVVVVTQEGALFHLQTPIWALNDDGSWFALDLKLEGKETAIAAELGRQPLLIDPNVYLMAQIDYDLGYTSDDWFRLYRHAPNAAQKLRLIATMARSDKKDVIALLAREEKTPEILIEMMPHLGLVSADLVLSLSRSADRLLMSTAIGKLKQVPKTEAGLARLREVWRNDRSDLMRRQAAESLVALTKDEAVVAEAWSKDSHADTLRDFALGWWAQNKPDVGREKCLEVLAHPTSEPLRQAAARHLGALKDRPGRREVLEALLSVAKEDSYGARLAAIASLGAYGSPEAIPVLRPLSDHPMFFLSESAKAALREIEKP